MDRAENILWSSEMFKTFSPAELRALIEQGRSVSTGQRPSLGGVRATTPHVVTGEPTRSSSKRSTCAGIIPSDRHSKGDIQCITRDSLGSDALPGQRS